MLEACLLLWSSLVTGRHASELLNMSVRMVAKGANLQAQSEGLISRNGEWAWWLEAGGPRQKRKRYHVCPTSEFIYLPATKRVTELIKRCVRLRRSGAAPFNLSGAEEPLFSIGEPLLAEATKLLAARHAISPERARRATTTPESVTRWLPGELIGLPGGDQVVAGVISGGIEDPAVTPSYYGAISHSAAVGQYRNAVASIDETRQIAVPSQLLKLFVGDRHMPTDVAVRDMAATLGAALKRPGMDIAERHRAMTRYTLGLLAFAFAHRGAIEMPSLDRMHPDSQFCWIGDKVLAHNRRVRRMVWVCATAREQLSLYEKHLELVRMEVSRTAARAIDALRLKHVREQTLVLCELTDAGGIREITPAAGIRDAMGGFGLFANAGRHWLRGKLVGICSTETLYAFYGHGPLDDRSWDASSTLDPVIYRADLAAALDPVLVGIGWTPKTVSRV